MADNGGYDGSINIRTKLDNSGLAADTAELTTKLDALSRKLSSMFKGGIKTGGLAQSLVSIRQKLEAIRADNTGETLRRQFEAASNAVARWDSELIRASRELDAMRDRLTSADGTFTPNTEYTQLESRITSMGTALRAAEQEQAQAEKRLISYETQREKKINDLTNAYERLNMRVQTAANAESKSTQKVSANVDKANKSISGTSKAAGNAAKYTRSFGEMLTRTAKRILIFRIVNTVFTAIATRFKALIASNNELQTSLGKLKGSLLTALQPLLDAVVPVLTKIFNIAAKVFKVIAAIIAALFGKTAAQAAAASAALDSEADSLSGVGSAAKKASKSLANFDEINQLTSASAGSGGGAWGGVGPIYDTEGLENVYAWLEKIKQSEAFQRLKEAWDRLKQKWDEFTNNPAVQRAFELLGKLLTDKIIPALLDSAWTTFEVTLDTIADTLQLIADICEGDLYGAINSIKDLLVDLTLGPLLPLAGLFDAAFGTDTQGKLRKVISIIKSFDLAAWVQKGWQTLKAIVGLALSVVTNALKKIDEKVIQPIKDWCDKHGVSEWVRNAWNDVKATASQIAIWWTKNVTEPVWSAIRDTINFIIRGINKLIAGINKINIKVNVPDWVADLMGWSRGGNVSIGFNIPKIPELARGAVIPPNAPFLAMLGDQKSGTNIEAPLDTLIEAFKAAQTEHKTEIVFKGSLAQLGQVLKPVIDGENKRLGSSFAH